MKSETKTTIEYPVEEFVELIKEQIFGNHENIDVNFVIEEVGGDPLDRFPGTDTVTKVRITYKGT